jgi:hypothetical protein
MVARSVRARKHFNPHLLVRSISPIVGTRDDTLIHFSHHSHPASQRLVDFIHDDGCYYLTVAAKLAQLGRSTFDGISTTNGYQPLWLLLLTIPARLIRKISMRCSH